MKGVVNPSSRPEKSGHGSEQIKIRRQTGVVVEEEETENEPLSPERFKRYKYLVAKLNYYSLDRPDILFAVKELMRKMSDPRLEDEVALKRVARYLIDELREVIRFPLHQIADRVAVYVDSDFAGCRRTRKSTSRGVIMWRPCQLKPWSKTQAVIALSS